MEQKLKQVIGDLHFALASIQMQLEEANKRIQELESEKIKKEKVTNVKQD